MFIEINIELQRDVSSLEVDLRLASALVVRNSAIGLGATSVEEKLILRWYIKVVCNQCREVHREDMKIFNLPQS